MNYTDYTITARPISKKIIAPNKIVRLIKKATFPYDFVCNLHPRRNDHHIHITIRTNSIEAFHTRFRYFLPKWNIVYCEKALSTKATVYYQSKNTAIYVAARVRREAAPCEAFLLYKYLPQQDGPIESMEPANKADSIPLSRHTKKITSAKPILDLKGPPRKF
jgi:hypothetical protein